MDIKNDEYAEARTALNRALQNILTGEQLSNEPLIDAVTQDSYLAIDTIQQAIEARFLLLLESVNEEVKRILAAFMQTQQAQQTAADIEMRTLEAERHAADELYDRLRVIHDFSDEELFDRFVSRAAAGAYSEEQIRRIIRLVL